MENTYKRKEQKLDCVQISAAGFHTYIRRQRKDPTIEIFAASIADINKALAVKAKIDPRTKLLKQYWKFLNLFDTKEAEKLPPARGCRVDYAIDLVEENRKQPTVP